MGLGVSLTYYNNHYVSNYPGMVNELVTDFTYSGMGVLGLSVLFLLRIMFKNGIFCYTPCGAHACIIDTNEGGGNLEKTIKHIANDHYEREVSKVMSLDDAIEPSPRVAIAKSVNQIINTNPRKFVEFFGSKHTDKNATSVTEMMSTDKNTTSVTEMMSTDIEGGHFRFQ
jgi:hypothetical protein